MKEANHVPSEKLPHISEAQPLTVDDQPLIDELVVVLGKHGALDRFGLTLLHKHFEVGDDEVLVESTDEDRRTQTIEPTPKSELADQEYTETSWHLGSGKPAMACVCINMGGDHQHHSRG